MEIDVELKDVVKITVKEILAERDEKIKAATAEVEQASEQLAETNRWCEQWGLMVSSLNRATEHVEYAKKLLEEYKNERDD